MADTYEQNLGQKSSLTTSDFIRVVGSDNASYKQGMDSVKNLFNVNMPIRQLTAPTYANLDTQITAFTADTSYFATVDGTDGPNGRNRWVVIGFENASHTYAFQRAMTFTGDSFERHKSNSTTWSAWVKEPTREEVDALNSNMSGMSFTRTNTTADIAKNITIPNNYRGIIATIDSTSTRCGMYFLYSSGSGMANTLPIREASGLTFGTSTNTLSITSPGATMIVILNASGKATT